MHLFCLDRTLVSYKDELTEVRKLASFACSEVEDKLNKRIGLKSKSDSLEVSVASSRNEIVRLEAALTSERRKLEQFLFEKNSVDDLLAVATTAEEVVDINQNIYTSAFLKSLYVKISRLQKQNIMNFS